MNTATLNVTNSELQQRVERELKWDPEVALATVGVTVKDHAVTLSGTVESWSNRIAAVRATKRVIGVRTIADDIIVHYPGTASRDDHAIASFIEHSFKWSNVIPETVRATVRDGIVNLDGAVNWHFERAAAERAVQHITGVTHVNNNITLTHQASAPTVHKRIEEALERNADADAAAIKVSSDGGDVTLDGSVSSWSKRYAAENAAWSAPGVTMVHDHIMIR
jgi:osmotically-inducible protein OsmY